MALLLTRRAALHGGISLAALCPGRTGWALMAKAASPAWPAVPPPLTPRVATPLTQLGRTRDDPYAWLKYVPATGQRDMATLPAPLRAHLSDERRYAEATLAPLRPRQRTLGAAMEARLPEETAEPALSRDGWTYTQRLPAGARYPVYERHRSGAAAELLVDENERAAGERYFRTIGHQASPDHRWFAWAEDVTGNDRHRICVRDTRTGRIATVVPGDAFGYGGFSFAPSSTSIFWIRMDARNRPTQVHRTPLDGGATELVYEERDPAIFIQLARTAQDGFVRIELSGPDTTEVRLVAAANERAAPTLIAARRPDVHYQVEEWRGALVVLTDEGGALDGKIVRAASPGQPATRSLVPHRPGTQILSMRPFERALVRLERRDGMQRLVLLRPDGSEVAPRFAGAAYSLTVPDGQDYRAAAVRVIHEAPDSPRRWLDVDLASGEATLVQAEHVPGFDPRRYVVERLFARAFDGELVPITLLSRRDAAHDGTAPLLLYGYGAYGVSTEAEFSIPATVLVDQGWRYAIAHVRGGSEKGRRWFLTGRKFEKRTSFTDFIACAEHLAGQRLADRRRIVAYGLSAGGLLVGASMNLRPDLWAGVVAKVPFVDMLNTMSDADHPLVPLFRPDWGDPLADPAAYDYIASISPYENVARAAYPPLLCTAGLKDNRVSYWEPAKLVAQVRDRSTSGNPAILLLDPDSGHQGSGNRASEFAELALFWAFAERCAAARPG